MLRSIFKYDKLKDVINIHETEVWLSIIISICLCWVLKGLDLYDNFNSFISTIDSILNCFIEGYLGIIGFALSGMALMLGLFGKKQIESIEKLNGKGVLEEIMSSYAFLAFVSAINLVILVVISFAIVSDKPLIAERYFWVLVCVICYLTLFNVFYAVALVFNCISLFIIYKLYNTETVNDNLSIANEVRVDYLLRMLVQICQLSREDVLNQLEEESVGLPTETRDALKKYFEKHYAREDS